MSFANIADPNEIRRKYRKPASRNDQAAGYVATWVKWPSGKYYFELYWVAMTTADLQTLITYFEANQGLAISFIDPDADFGTTHWVKISDDEINATPRGPGTWTVTVNLEEIQ